MMCSKQKEKNRISFDQVIQMSDLIAGGDVVAFESFLDSMPKEACKRLISTLIPVIGKDINGKSVYLTSQDSGTTLYKVVHDRWIEKGYVDE